SQRPGHPRRVQPQGRLRRHRNENRRRPHLASAFTTDRGHTERTPDQVEEAVRDWSNGSASVSQLKNQEPLTRRTLLSATAATSPLLEGGGVGGWASRLPHPSGNQAPPLPSMRGEVAAVAESNVRRVRGSSPPSLPRRHSLDRGEQPMASRRLIDG